MADCGNEHTDWCYFGVYSNDLTGDSGRSPSFRTWSSARGIDSLHAGNTINIYHFAILTNLMIRAITLSASQNNGIPEAGSRL